MQQVAAGADFHRDNHYVSRLYLKRWAVDSRRVWTYRILVSHPEVPLWRKSSIKGLAYHEHLYTRIVAVGQTDEIERWVDAEFEAPAEEAIRKVVAEGRLAREDWECLIRFLAAQDVRTPARLLEMLQRWRKTLPDIVQTTLQESVEKLEEAKRDGRAIVPSHSVEAKYFPSRVTTEIAPGAKTGQIKVETIAGRGLWLFSLRHLLTKTIQALLKHRWTILQAPQGTKWITSDDPVVRLNYQGPHKYDFREGWGSKGTEIFLPLSPRHLLYTRIGEKPPQRGKVIPQSMADLLQRFNAEHAHRLIFATEKEPRVVTLRPRTVDSVLLQSEAEQWARWHQEQADAERELYS